MSVHFLQIHFKEFIIKFFKETGEIEIELIYNNTVGLVKANTLLEEVIHNIILNAITHNDKVEKTLTIILSEEKNKVRIDFLDNGAGIEDERKKEIFLRGHSKNGTSSGMGLGLSLVKQIIDAFGGDVWVENRDENDIEKGSKFVVVLISS